MFSKTWRFFSKRSDPNYRADGDGTTTPTVLIQEIQEEDLSSRKGTNPMELKKGIEKAISIITEELGKQAIVVGSDYDKIKQIGYNISK